MTELLILVLNLTMAHNVKGISTKNSLFGYASNLRWENFKLLLENNMIGDGLIIGDAKELLQRHN